ncbi:LysR family transcriptional regulator [Bermanella marisrubri]|uniref:Transcriptional regulators, LysR family protein n=1 Tax=Bermanella marisrubri TaxID=207949 RepID=Q1N5N9_9GAMM|nr:LysR family transcriptional regulator [Bermanella marisrubri]EAT13903.1 transcriptional regulators, LysR family protein [Oceanobacter sp. RED65] [Bermanella marisrubri]QIZ84658.1 LysR family transcriptional regulator [Bermanella marisrubri]
MSNFEGIQEFVAVAEAQGFSAAAKQLDASTSHISRQVARLEERLGVQLLARTTRMVSLTDAGERYYTQCRELIDGLQQADESVSDESIKLTGTLKVSAAGTFAEQFIAPCLMQFAKSHPELSIEMDFNSRMVNFVEEGFDFAIRYGRLKDSGLVARRLIQRHLMAAASPEYLKQFGEPTHPDDLKHHKCLLTNNDHWLFSENQQSFDVKVSGPWRSNNANVVLQACEHGMGIAYMPVSSFEQSINSGRLKPILRDYWSHGITSWIVYQNRRFLPMRARLAIDYLLQHFKDWDE